MSQKSFLRIRTVEELDWIKDASGLPRFQPENLVEHAPDAHWILLDSNGAATGRCSLWWRNVPAHAGQRLGVIGHYAAAHGEAASQLLQYACTQLAERGCDQAVGPMDGTTWRRYRLITERGDEPAFFLEPDNPVDWPGHFLGEGFVPLANYFSALVSDLSRADPSARLAEQHLSARGVQVRALDPGQFEAELRRVYAITMAGFRHGFLFTPLSEGEFLTQYKSLASLIRPELVLIAEQQHEPVGFIFSVPDWNQARGGQAVDTVILKTVAVLPGRARSGLGAYLVARIHAVARALGYQRVIHALMHESNYSRNISARYARPMRRYALFGKSLVS
jgi:GNAT superfamily N-acetyltransferase